MDSSYLTLSSEAGADQTVNSEKHKTDPVSQEMGFFVAVIPVEPGKSSKGGPVFLPGKKRVFPRIVFVGKEIYF